MTQEPRYGAGLWHFAQYVDRYATDGYGPPVTTLEAIDLAGQVGDLAVVEGVAETRHGAVRRAVHPVD